MDLEHVVVPRRLQVADAYFQDRQVDPALLDLRVREPQRADPLPAHALEEPQAGSVVDDRIWSVSP
jgi:hypothetical protein